MKADAFVEILGRIPTKCFDPKTDQQLSQSATTTGPSPKRKNRNELLKGDISIKLKGVTFL